MRLPRGLATVLAISQLASLPAVLSAPPAVAAPGSLPPTEWVVGPSDRVAFLTFEGKTKGKHLADLVELLARKRAKAAFFLPGPFVNHHKNKMRMIRAAGHTLGNRGFGKGRFTTLTDAEIRTSIQQAQDALNKVGAHPKPFLRAPEGARDQRVLRVAGSMGYRHVRWTHHPGGDSPRDVARKVVRKAQAGSIISLDLWRRAHRGALDDIIEGLRKRNFKIRSLDRLQNAHAVRWDVTLKSGSSGREVSYLQKTLKSISYLPGQVDGKFGYATLQAVYAFEKVHGMSRDGVVPPSEMTKIAMGKRPPTPDRGARHFVDIDISRQVLFEIRKRRVIRTIAISSGNEEYYTVDGERYKAHTPRGDFKIERKISGWRTSRLGRLWYPSYFVGGYAVHGSTSVPTYPDSHGCVRIPMYATKGFFKRNPVGRYVYVHN